MPELCVLLSALRGQAQAPQLPPQPQHAQRQPGTHSDGSGGRAEGGPPPGGAAPEPAGAEAAGAEAWQAASLPSPPKPGSSEPSEGSKSPAFSDDSASERTHSAPPAAMEGRAVAATPEPEAAGAAAGALEVAAGKNDGSCDAEASI